MPDDLVASANGINKNPCSKVAISPAIAAGETTAVILTVGQSTVCNNDDTGYSAVSSKAQNFNVYDGGVYPIVDPLLGCQGFGGNWAGRLADKLITAGIFQRVIIAPVGIGGTFVAEWASGGRFNQRILTAVARLNAIGLAPTMCLWMQGENDASASTTQSAYQTSLSSVISSARANGLPSSTPWFVSQTTYPSTTSSTAVRAAQAAIVDNSIKIYAGPDTDTLTGANRQNGGTAAHWTAVGSDACAGLWKTAIDVVF
jgi:hypothetical protein